VTLSAHDDRAPAAPESGAPAVDVRALAERVYRLMLADARLERARGAAANRNSRG
jgi:hypothetical protein